MAYITSYYGKQNHIKPLNAEQVAEDVFFLYVFKNAFPASLF